MSRSRTRRATPYEKLKERARARNAALALAGRDIGELPAVVQSGAQGASRDRLPLLLRILLPADVSSALVARPLEGASTEIEQAVLHGGLFAMAMPRGSGKTTICRSAPASGRCSTAIASSSA